MQTFRTIAEYKSYLNEVRRSAAPNPLRIGFVPTMGFLHEGHLSLIARAKQESDIVVMSVFVNPLQFGPNEDFDRYPRDEQRDLELMARSGVDAAFLPDVQEMYPTAVRTTVTVSQVTDRLCGASRPGHFDGVATVVMKLFHIVEPDLAFFGQKDAQQVAVIQQMVNDLNVPVQVVPCATLREPDGLAMSSRNVYLSPEERKQAPILHAALQLIPKWLSEHNNITASQLIEKIRGKIAEAPDAVIDYVEVLSYPGLEPIDGPIRSAPGAFIAALAVKFGKTRLIDNALFGGVTNVSYHDEIENSSRRRDGSQS